MSTAPVPITARAMARMMVRIRLVTILFSGSLLFCLTIRRGLAGQLDDGGAQGRPADCSRKRYETLSEVAVDALIRALAVVRRVEPVAGLEARQVVAGDHESGEALQGVHRVVAGVLHNHVDRYEDERLVLPVGLDDRLAGLRDARSRASAVSPVDDRRRAGAGWVSCPAEQAWPVGS